MSKSRKMTQRFFTLLREELEDQYRKKLKALETETSKDPKLQPLNSWPVAVAAIPAKELFDLVVKSDGSGYAMKENIRNHPAAKKAMHRIEADNNRRKKLHNAKEAKLKDRFDFLMLDIKNAEIMNEVDSTAAEKLVAKIQAAFV